MKRYTITGNSMIPTLMPGDTVCVDSSLTPKKHDLVCFLNPENRTPTVHRMLRKWETAFLTQGDHCLFVDSPIPMGAFLGVVSKILPEGKSPPYRLPKLSPWKNLCSLLSEGKQSLKYFLKGSCLKPRRRSS